MIEIKHLSKHYGDQAVLDDINWRMEPGQVYGVVGPNGAGKTTLFRCLAGMESYAGVIESDFKLLKNHIGLLETHPIFMSRITGWEYLKLLCSARHVEADDFDDQNIFDLPLHRFANQYSTGMKKKLALMGVVLQQNDVYILDEPFNGVDINSNMLIIALIQKLKASQKTVLISSHIFSTLVDTCDEILVLNNGQIAQAVMPEQYAALEVQMKQEVITERLELLRI